MKENVSPDFQVSSVLCKFQDRPFLFENVSGSSSCSGKSLGYTREYRARIKTEQRTLLESLEKAVKNPTPKSRITSTFKKSDWEFSGEADSSKLPVLKHFENDAGNYLTAGIVAAKFPGKDSENLSVHRMLVLSKNKVAARVVPRHLNQIAKEVGGKVPSRTLIIEPPPEVFVSASLQLQYGISEYDIANSLSGGTLNSRFVRVERHLRTAGQRVYPEGFIDFNEQWRKALSLTSLELMMEFENNQS